MEAAAATDERAVPAVLLAVDRDWYAVDLRRVREVVAEPLVTALPTAPPAVLGVFNLRGDIVPLFDSAAVVGVGAIGAAHFAVVVESAHGPCGLATTAMPESVELLEPLSSAEVHGATLAYAVGRRVVTLLDLDALLVPAHAAR